MSPEDRADALAAAAEAEAERRAGILEERWQAAHRSPVTVRTPQPGDWVHAWPDPGDPWPECGTVLEVTAEDVVVQWDHLPMPVTHHGYLPHLTFVPGLSTPDDIGHPDWFAATGRA